MNVFRTGVGGGEIQDPSSFVLPGNDLLCAIKSCVRVARSSCPLRLPRSTSPEPSCLRSQDNQGKRRSGLSYSPTFTANRRSICYTVFVFLWGPSRCFRALAGIFFFLCKWFKSGGGKPTQLIKRLSHKPRDLSWVSHMDKARHGGVH